MGAIRVEVQRVAGVYFVRLAVIIEFMRSFQGKNKLLAAVHHGFGREFIAHGNDAGTHDAVFFLKPE